MNKVKNWLNEWIASESSNKCERWIKQWVASKSKTRTWIQDWINKK